MPNTILLKRGTTEPTSGVLSVGELAIDTTNGNTYTKLNDGTVSLLGSRASKVEIPVRNETGSTIPAGSAVYITGASANKPLISLAQANAEMTSSKTLGLTTTSIVDGHNGYVILFGSLDKIDTLAYSAGQALWLSATVAGGLVATPPSQPNHSVFIGIVITSANNGKIEVKIANGYELEELHNISIVDKNDNDIIAYDLSSGLWKNKTVAALGLATESFVTSQGYVTNAELSVLRPLDNFDFTNISDTKLTTFGLTLTPPVGTVATYNSLIDTVQVKQSYDESNGGTQIGYQSEAFHSIGGIYAKSREWTDNQGSIEPNTGQSVFLGLNLLRFGDWDGNVFSSIWYQKDLIRFPNGSTQNTAFQGFNNAALTGNVTITTNSSNPALAITQDGAGDIIQFNDVSNDTTYSFIDASGKVNTIAPTTSNAGFRLPHGAVPTNPVDGDIWTTSFLLQARHSGVTKTYVNIQDPQTFLSNMTFANHNGTFGGGIASGTITLAAGNTASGNTKTVNIGTGGVSGSTTNITIGATAGTSTTTLNGTTTGVTQANLTNNTTLATTEFVASSKYSQNFVRNSAVSIASTVIGAGANSGTLLGGFRTIAPTSAIGSGISGFNISFHNRNIIGQSTGFDWSKRFIGQLRYQARTLGTDANTVNRVCWGKAGNNIGGDLAVRGVAIKQAANGALTLQVHNGTTLTSVSSSVIPVVNPVYDIRITSDGVGNVTLFVNDLQVATTNAGPTSGSGINTNWVTVESENIAIISSGGTNSQYVAEITTEFSI